MLADWMWSVVKLANEFTYNPFGQTYTVIILKLDLIKVSRFLLDLK